MRKIFTIMSILCLFTILCLTGLTGCDVGDAQVASYNLSKDADNFKVYRRAIFYNGITGEYMLSIEGYLSIEDQGNQLEVTVKSDDGTYLKHFLGLSNNVTYFVEQLNPILVSDKRYKTIFKPSVIIPYVEIR